MANFAVVVDPDPARRARFAAAAGPRLHLLPGLLAGSCGEGEFQAIWAAALRAPVGTARDRDGAAVIWGEAIAPPSAARIAPGQLRKRWHPASDPNGWLTWDGFFAAVVYHRLLGVVAGADLLGLMPVYYWSNGEVLLIASSPEIFPDHPSFHSTLDPVALTGILITNGLFRGRALWKGVRRLAPAHFLRWERGGAAAELPDRRLASELEAHDSSSRPFPEQLEILDAACARVVRRHAPPEEPCGVFLSGGLDSRLVAGYLDRQGTRPIALTLGDPRDLELRCARRVAEALGLEHHTASVPYDLYPVFAAALTSRWEHLANGGGVIFGWGAQAFLSALPPRVATGIPLDWAFGGPATFGLAASEMTFERCFPLKLNDSGFSPALLARLLRREVFGDVVEAVLHDIRTDYEKLADDPLRRLWFFGLYHRARFNAGVGGWHLCFGSWPVMIALDRDWFATVAGTPPATLADRRAEQALLRTRFPRLARLPLDRNGYLTTPLLAGRLRRFVDRFPSYVLTRWVAPRLGPQRERRYYYRIYDLNNAGWRAVRQLAEPQRQRLKALFVPEVLDEILPSPSARVLYHGDLISEGLKLKQLLILALWAGDHM